MPASLTEEEFSKHVNTKFGLTAGEQSIVDLELVEVKNYMSEHNEQPGMERFSLYFQGPVKPFLPQATYSLMHDQMGEVIVFIVPIEQNDTGFRYESVFNYFKESEQ